MNGRRRRRRKTDEENSHRRTLILLLLLPPLLTWISRRAPSPAPSLHFRFLFAVPSGDLLCFLSVLFNFPTIPPLPFHFLCHRRANGTTAESKEEKEGEKRGEGVPLSSILSSSLLTESGHPTGKGVEEGYPSLTRLHPLSPSPATERMNQPLNEMKRNEISPLSPVPSSNAFIPEKSCFPFCATMMAALRNRQRRMTTAEGEGF